MAAPRRPQLPHSTSLESPQSRLKHPERKLNEGQRIENNQHNQTPSSPKTKFRPKVGIDMNEVQKTNKKLSPQYPSPPGSPSSPPPSPKPVDAKRNVRKSGESHSPPPSPKKTWRKSNSGDQTPLTEKEEPGKSRGSGKRRDASPELERRTISPRKRSHDSNTEVKHDEKAQKRKSQGTEKAVVVIPVEKREAPLILVAEDRTKKLNHSDAHVDTPKVKRVVEREENGRNSVHEKEELVDTPKTKRVEKGDGDTLRGSRRIEKEDLSKSQGYRSRLKTVAADDLSMSDSFETLLKLASNISSLQETSAEGSSTEEPVRRLNEVTTKPKLKKSDSLLNLASLVNDLPVFQINNVPQSKGRSNSVTALHRRASANPHQRPKKEPLTVLSGSSPPTKTSHTNQTLSPKKRRTEITEPPPLRNQILAINEAWKTFSTQLTQCQTRLIEEDKEMEATKASM